VVLVEPAFEESIGFTARAMKNFGLEALHLVNPVTTLSKEGRMRGAHAQDILDSIMVHDSLLDALKGLNLVVGTTAQKAHSDSNLIRKPMSPRELAGVVPRNGTVGIVLGREGTGLNNHELSLCDALVTIPAVEEYPTLNISHAAAIIFYELSNPVVATVDEELGNENVKETILSYLAESLAVTGLEDYKIGLTTRALKNVMGRSAMRRREGSLLAGAFRQISQVLSNQRSPEPLREASVTLQLED
jgi:TrmH family RNA methyltransferase